MLGVPSRFAPQCEKVQAETKAKLVLLMVVNGYDSEGNVGNGIACCGLPGLTEQVPALLRQYADQLEAQGGLLMVEGPAGAEGGKGPRRRHGK